MTGLPPGRGHRINPSSPASFTALRTEMEMPLLSRRLTTARTNAHDLRRLRRREYISVGVYIRACCGVSEKRRRFGPAFTAVAQIKLPSSKSRRRRRCTRVLDLVCAPRFFFCNTQQEFLPLPSPRLLRIPGSCSSCASRMYVGRIYREASVNFLHARERIKECTARVIRLL